MAKRIYSADVQFLIIAGARGAGLDASGAVVFPRDEAAGDMSALGLRPLVVLALVVPAFAIYFRRVVDPTAASNSVTRFLADAWSESTGIGLPLELEVRQTSASVDQGFLAWAAQVVPTVKVMPKGAKAHVAFEKEAAKVLAHICVWHRHDYSHPESMSLDEANTGLRSYDRFVAQHALCEKGMVQLNHHAFLNREKRFCDRGSLPRDCHLQALQLHAGHKPPASLEVDENDWVHHPPPGVKYLVDQWPGGRAKLLKSVGLKGDVFDWWVQGKAHLPEVARCNLFEQLFVVRDRYSEEYDYELTGGYFIIGKNRRAVTDLYTELSHGGDLRLSFEVLPPRGERANWRVLVFADYGSLANVFALPRESWADSVLTEEGLINFGGTVVAPAPVWNSIEKMLRLQGDFPRIEQAGAQLESEHATWFDELEGEYSVTR